MDHYIPGEANISQPKLRSEKMDNNKNSQINVLLIFLVVVVVVMVVVVVVEKW